MSLQRQRVCFNGIYRHHICILAFSDPHELCHTKGWLCLNWDVKSRKHLNPLLFFILTFALKHKYPKIFNSVLFFLAQLFRYDLSVSFLSIKYEFLVHRWMPINSHLVIIYLKCLFKSLVYPMFFNWHLGLWEKNQKWHFSNGWIQY